jgi:hypothetical protein
VQYNLTWNDKIAKLVELFFSFSVKDISTSLLCSYLWLPNIASPIKHLFLYSILASLEPTKFQKEDKIRQYEDFVTFLKNIYSLVPSFYLLEDYIPEIDWGEVKFHYKNHNYKIFYGSELGNVYDYLTLFQIIYTPWDEEYFQQTNRSASKELEFCLKLQDYFISEIKQNVDKKRLETVEPGSIEIPEKEFWESISLFISIFDPLKIMENGNPIEMYSINIGEYNFLEKNEQSFNKMCLKGTLLPYYFLKVSDKYYPLMPRRFSMTLIDKWAVLLYAIKDKISKGKFSYSLGYGGALHKYIKGRCKTRYIFPLVSAVDKENRAHSLIYNTSLIVKNKLLLIYLLEPTSDFSEELQKVKKEVKESLELLENQPTTLALHLERKNISFTPHSSKEQLEPYPIILIPNIFTELSKIEIPVDMPGKVLPLDNFLALIDEVEDIQELIEFFNFLDSEERIKSPFTIILDKFGAYKDSAGVLVPGAREPNLIGLDPHWGSHFRYKSLKAFWEIYPPVDFFDHPRTWKVSRETPTRIRFEARGFLGAAIYTAINDSNLFCNAPFHAMNFDQAQLSNLLMECLEDSISAVKDIIKNLAVFSQYRQFQVSFFPDSLVQSNDDFKHLRHLNCKGKLWMSDTGFVQEGIPGLRIVFNYDQVQKSLLNAKDNSTEIKLLIEFLEKINAVCYDHNIRNIKKLIIRRIHGKKPRFKIFMFDKEVEFPDLASFVSPEPKHFKLARKSIAQIAKNSNINSGEYVMPQAKDIIDKVKKEVISELNKKVRNFDFRSSIPFLIGNTDGVLHLFEREKMLARQSDSIEVDYERDKKYSETYRKFISNHKNYRYLIEKFVQLKPSGKEKLTEDILQYLLALIDQLHLIYEASDFLHYGIQPIGLVISDDYIFQVKYEQGFDEKQKAFAQEQAKYDLGVIGERNDRVFSPRDVKVFIEELNEAFYSELSFSLQNMVLVCEILSNWPFHNKTQINTYYTSKLEEIVLVCEKNIPSLKKNEIIGIIGFLTLKQENMLKIDGQENPCEDLPVWEISKRLHRYNLKPLILIDDFYYWGPYSTQRVGKIWVGRILSGSLPVLIDKKKIGQVLEEEKKLIEKTLETRTYEISKRFTVYVEKNVELYKRDKGGRHPVDLGDYDVLAFLETKNVILNIECKDILQVSCLKDVKRLREKIFGEESDRGHIGRIEVRTKYLIKNITRIMMVLQWPFDRSNIPNIVSIYVSRHLYWWTVNPPYETDIKFIRIDSLDDFLSNLSNNS